ncbi:MAG: 16S rRNA (cytosine(1402)-N(4))-methyltransferase RsmH [Gemmatimonadota bacterium]|nr:MAG: 16S rRNA (cytosine(1402)-N(4))-methyltransferase RsmH [Gemmatimonadota bacterium]
MSAFHEPVLLTEVVRLLAPERGGVFLDGTVGGGGHAEAILRAGTGVRLLALDRDAEALESARDRLRSFAGRVEYREGDFAETADLFGLGEGALAGVLLDLGVSSHQIDRLERGFTFRAGAPLDMRMSRRSSTTAAELLEAATAEELGEIFRTYAEERRGRRLAAGLVEARRRKPLRKSDDLIEAIEAVWGRRVAESDLARIFQALRIAVNHELDSLGAGLPVLRDLLQPGGRLVVISYHSLEDRLVKRAFREWGRDCVCPPGLPECRCRGRALGRELTRKPVRPEAAETDRNPRARSARLRAWESAG